MRGVSAPDATTYDKDDSKFLDQRPFEGVLVAAICGIGGGRLGAAQGGGAALFLDECVGDEVVDDGRVHGRIRPGPEDDARRCEDLECVQHVVMSRGRRSSMEGRIACVYMYVCVLKRRGGQEEDDENGDSDGSRRSSRRKQ